MATAEIGPNTVKTRNGFKGSVKTFIHSFVRLATIEFKNRSVRRTAGTRCGPGESKLLLLRILLKNRKFRGRLPVDHRPLCVRKVFASCHAYQSAAVFTSYSQLPRQIQLFSHNMLQIHSYGSARHSRRCLLVHAPGFVHMV